mmetsp:Transcript_12973/g.22513  ORF Transcript_12973/g.22513 Transcript_12973/m.22513 type:complete len:136 (+) Transcript_12973:53-460(+)
MKARDGRHEAWDDLGRTLPYSSTSPTHALVLLEEVAELQVEAYHRMIGSLKSLASIWQGNALCCLRNTSSLASRSDIEADASIGCEPQLVRHCIFEGWRIHAAWSGENRSPSGWSVNQRASDPIGADRSSQRSWV